MISINYRGGIKLSEKNIMRRWVNEYVQEGNTYKNHVTKFIEYIESIGKGNKPVAINKEDVIGSIGFQNEFGKINSYSSMENHLESVKSFYKFLVRKDYAEDIFSSIHSYQEYKDYIADKYNLREVKEREYLNNKTIIEILEYLDTYFEKTDYSTFEGINEKKRYLKNIITRLFIKLTLIAPAKRGVICDIKIHDFIDDFRFVNVNDVKIRITNSLRKDIYHALNFVIKYEKLMAVEEDKIFEYILNGFQPENLNSWFCSVLKEIEFDMPEKKDTYSVEVIMNTAVVNMVRNMVNPALIAKINGTKISSIEKKFYNDRNINKEDFNKFINYEICKASYYNYI